MGAVVGLGVASLTSNLIGAHGARRDANRQNAALARQQARYERLLENRLSDWNNIYGNILENQKEYYSSLTGDSLAAQGVEQQQLAYQKIEQNLKANLAKRGISDSKFGQSQLNQAYAQNEISKANIRTQAPVIAAQQRQGFLNQGLQERNAIYGQQAQAFNTNTQIAANRAAQADANYRSRQNAVHNSITDLAGAATYLHGRKLGLGQDQNPLVSNRRLDNPYR